MTPQNLRFHATDTVRRLVEEGATSLQVTVVPVAGGGDELTDHFRFEGVTVEFKD
jgi:hypothetical protein